MPDDVITRAGPVAVPLSYQVPTGTEIIPRALSASFDGSQAAGAYVPALEVIAPNGAVTAYCARQGSIAAGASVLVSWFPGVAEADQPSAATPSSGTISSIGSPLGTIAVTAPSGPTTSIDLPASGAPAGTYGDATHTAQVTVNAEGVVTNAAQIPISGIAGTGLVKLFDSTLAIAANTIDTGANAIPTGHGDLMIVITGRSSGAGNGFSVLLTFNGDGGNHYNYFVVRDNSGALGDLHVVAAAAALPGQLPGAGSTANYPASMTIWVPGYDGTTFFKQANSLSGYGDAGGVTFQQWSGSFGWASTAAINQVTIALNTPNNFVAGTRMAIYGMQ